RLPRRLPIPGGEMTNTKGPQNTPGYFMGCYVCYHFSTRRLPTTASSPRPPAKKATQEPRPRGNPAQQNGAASRKLTAPLGRRLTGQNGRLVRFRGGPFGQQWCEFERATSWCSRPTPS